MDNLSPEEVILARLSALPEKVGELFDLEEARRDAATEQGGTPSRR
jgi:hypothetical protein